MSQRDDEFELAIAQATRTWDALLRRYQDSEKGWVDAENHHEHPQMLCEALEAFFIPALAHPRLERRLKDLGWGLYATTLGRVLAMLEKQDGFYADDTYISGSWPGGERQELVEVAAFTATAILHFKYLFAGEASVEKSLLDRADKWLVRALEFIHACHLPGEGWMWGSKKPMRATFLYFTYTVLEALEDVFDPRFVRFVPSGAGATLDLLKKDIVEACEYLVANHIETSALGMNIRERIAFGEDTSWYYNLWVVMGLSVARAAGVSVDTDKLGGAIDTFRGKLMDRKTRLLDTGLGQPWVFPLEYDESLGIVDVPMYSDRAGIPLSLKVLIVAENNDLFGTATRAQFEESRRDLWKIVFDDKALADEPDLWERAGFSIYYTERVMEVCARFLGADVIQEQVQAERTFDFISSVPLAGLSAQLGVAALEERVQALEGVIAELRGELASQKKAMQTLASSAPGPAAADVPPPAGTALIESARLAVEKVLESPRAKKLPESDRTEFQGRLKTILDSDSGADVQVKELKSLAEEIREYLKTVGRD